MPDTYATRAQFEARYGAVPAAEQGQVEELLKDATELVRAELTDSASTWIPEAAAADGVPRAVVAVTAAAAYRAWTNPNAVAREGEADVSVSYAAAGPDALYLTPYERKTLRRAAGLLAGAGSLTLTSPYSETATDDDPLL